MFTVKNNMVRNIFVFLIISFGKVSKMLLGEKLWASLELLNPISKMLLEKVYIISSIYDGFIELPALSIFFIKFF